MTIFKFTRSDGNVAHWPDSANKPILAYKQILNQYDPIARDDKRYQHWLKKIGAYIAEKQGLPGGDHWISDFPAGFRLYVHLTQKAGAALRKDVFLFGRENVRFRSPAEFQPHAWWLMRPDFDAPCACSWCAGPGAGRTYLVETDEGLRPARDSQPNTYVYSAFPRTIRERIFNSNSGNQPVRLPALDLDYVAPLRLKELHETRRYRNGEIIWVPVKPIKHTFESRGSLTAATTVEEHKASLTMPKIDYWPGLIKEPRLISRPVKTETMGQVITQTWDYVCSCIAINHEIQVSEAELLPFLAYAPKEGNYEDVLQALARLDKLPEFEGPNRQTFAEVFQSWESAVLSYAVALSTVDVAVDCCICTNEFFTPLELNILGYKGEDYQGLWWGAERLWMGDLCRLQSTRETLNLDLLPPFNPSIEPGGLFLQITLISKTPSTLSAPPSGIVAGRLFDLVDEGQVAEGSWSLSVSTNDKGQDKTTSPWPPFREPISSQQCSASANHLASSFSPTLSSPASASAQQQQSNEPKTYFEALAITSTDVWPLPEPPRGKSFRQIHPTSTQLVVALDQIAGRYYPGLSREGAAAWIWRDEQLKKTLASLEGRSEGWVARLECTRWKKDRWEQIFDSLREVVEERVEALFRELRAASEPAGSTVRRRTAAEVETADAELNGGSKKRRTAGNRQNEGQGDGGPQSLRAG